MRKNDERPVVEVKPHKYQPSKAEFEADACITTTPENLAQSVLRQVTVMETEDS